MKKILIVSDVAPPQINGVLRTMQKTTEILKNRGYQVDMISPLDYKTIPVPFYSEIRLALPPYNLDERLDGYDAIHIVSEGPLGLAARISAAKRKRAFTTAYHTKFPGLLKNMIGFPEAWTYAYQRWFHNLADTTMVPTKSMIELLKTKGFTKLALWGRGVDETIFYPRLVDDIDVGRRPYFLNVGRVSPEKNLRAFLDLNIEGTKIVIGDGPTLPALKKEYPDVVFLGVKKGKDLSDWYCRADVFVFPSLEDTFGLVIAEAIASGIPVAAFPVPGPVDIVEDGVTGILSNDLEAAAIGCLHLGGFERNFSWDKATDQFISNLKFR